MAFKYIVWITLDTDDEEFGRVPHLEDAFNKTQFIPRDRDRIEVYPEESVADVDFHEIWVSKDGRQYLEPIRKEHLIVDGVFINLMREEISVYLV